jgi:hypothetical protein
VSCVQAHCVSDEFRRLKEVNESRGGMGIVDCVFKH